MDVCKRHILLSCNGKSSSRNGNILPSHGRCARGALSDLNRFPSLPGGRAWPLFRMCLGRPVEARMSFPCSAQNKPRNFFFFVTL